MISSMVTEGRIEASLDQETRLIEFERESKHILTFDSQVQHLCNDIGGLISDILKKRPELKKYAGSIKV
jgi:hypothetical protein